jgi:hypothetical protein
MEIKTSWNKGLNKNSSEIIRRIADQKRTGQFNSCRTCNAQFWVNKRRALAKYCCNQCHWLARKGKRLENHPHYKGGRIKEGDGYIALRVNGVYRPEHRYLMEQHLKRTLSPDEVVHHINHVKDDNRIENLQVMTRSEHARLHHSPTVLKATIK